MASRPLKHFMVHPQSPEMVYLNEGRAPRGKDFTASKGRGVLVLHGLGSHCSNMGILTDRLIANEYHVFGYNYRSYADIRQSAGSLKDLLRVFMRDCGGASCRLNAVGHSMGGLVLRELVAFQEGETFLKSIVMLGTPNGSTLNKKLVKYLLKHVQHVSELFDPDTRRILGGEGIQQLLRLDARAFLNGLNETERKRKGRIRYLTIAAGGGPHLRLHARGFVQRLVVEKIQEMLDDPRNDGIVIEGSVDLRKVLRGAEDVERFGHLNEEHYSDFFQLDHSGLVQSQIVAELIMAFIESPESPDGESEGESGAEAGV